MFSVSTGKLVKHIPRDNAPSACSFGKRTKKKEKKNAARTGGGRRNGRTGRFQRMNGGAACTRATVVAFKRCPAATVETFTRISRRGEQPGVFSDSVCDSRGHVGPSAGETSDTRKRRTTNRNIVAKYKSSQSPGVTTRAEL